MTKRFLLILMAVAAFFACSDDDKFTASPTAMLTFSADSVKMDTVFSTVGSRTYDFWVYNRCSRGLRLQSVRLRQGNQTGFRVNVDGSYLDNDLGSIVTGLEVRSGDSLRIFVEFTAAKNQQLTPQMVQDDLLFLLESGVEQRVVLRAYAWDAQLYDSLVVSSDSVIETRQPIVIRQGLRVDSAATLTVRNTSLFFHNKAGADIYGTLITDSVVMRGDRLDHMFDYLPYDRVSGQWRGLRFFSTSFHNELIATEIRNAESGIVCDSASFSNDQQRLYMERSVVHNCAGDGLLAFNSWVGLLRCQFSNTQGDCLAFYGGAAVMDHCTVAQFYPFVGGRGAALRFANFYGENAYPLHTMTMTNSIVTGYDDDVVMGQTLEGDTITPFSYSFDNTLLRTPALEDTINCKNMMWETSKDSIQGKQHFRLVDEKNLIYDFHLDSLSTAQGKGCYE
ncbi:MAG: right-handed parallel beta-helix repeat-containing protein [Prevotella sp.]|nr:right-handed parallel beta-helix repeat-containing protein [Prevotella sp.]